MGKMMPAPEKKSIISWRDLLRRQRKNMFADGRPATAAEEQRGTVEEVMPLGSVLEPLDWRRADRTSETVRKRVMLDDGPRNKEASLVRFRAAHGA